MARFFAHDYDPSALYAKIVSSEIIELSSIGGVDAVVNYIQVPEDIKTSLEFSSENLRPQLLFYNGRYYIHANTAEQVLLMSALLPKCLRVEVLHAEPAHVATRRAMAFGATQEVAELDESLYMTYFNDAVLENLIKEDADFFTGESTALTLVKNYIRAYRPGETVKCPLLYGHTGISKSAIVRAAVAELDAESVAKGEYGYRVVDLKIGFFDKNDIYGFTSLEKINDKTVWTDSPCREILICTDSFVEACRSYLEQNPDLKKQDPKAYDKLRYFAKTPVIFFDEINRASAAMMNIAMRLINASVIGGYVMRNAPKVAAANINLDEGLENFIEYLVTELTDVAAAAGRFNRIYVDHNDMSLIEATAVYLSSNVAETDVTRSLIDAALNKAYENENVLYNPKLVDDDGKFPTFRGWEFLIRYLDKKINRNEPILKSVIEGCIGKNAASSVASMLKEISSDISIEDKDDVDSFLSDCFNNGIPVALFGRYGVAKTAKVMQACKNSPNVEVEIVDLSVEEKTTMRGSPFKCDFVSEMLGDTEISDDFRQFAVEKFNIPKFTTAFIPYEALVEKVERAKAQGKRLVFVLDECNRANPVVQSAIFDIISERKFKGVDLSDIEYSVVATGNWEADGANYNTGTMDSAIRHRFATKFIKEITKDDYAAFKNYLEKNDVEALQVLELLEKSKGLDEVLTILNTMPEPDSQSYFLTKIFTFREVSMLGDTLRQFKSAIIGTEVYSKSELAKILDSDDYILNKHETARKAILDIRNDDFIKRYVDAKTTRMPLQQLIKVLRAALPQMSEGDVSELRSWLYSIERKLLEPAFKYIRENIPEQISGDAVNIFTTISQSYTKEILNTDEGELRLLSDDEAIINRKLSLILNNIDPVQSNAAVVAVVRALSEELEATEEKVDLSAILRVVKIYNSTQWGIVRTLHISQLQGLLTVYKDKITKTEIPDDFKQKVFWDFEATGESLRRLYTQIVDNNASPTDTEMPLQEVASQIERVLYGFNIDPSCFYFTSSNTKSLYMGYSVFPSSVDKHIAAYRQGDVPLDVYDATEEEELGEARTKSSSTRKTRSTSTSKRRGTTRKSKTLDSSDDASAKPVAPKALKNDILAQLTVGDDIVVVPNIFEVYTSIGRVLQLSSECFKLDAITFDEDKSLIIYTMQYAPYGNSDFYDFRINITIENKFPPNIQQGEAAAVDDTASIPALNVDDFVGVVSTAHFLQYRKETVGEEIAATDAENLQRAIAKCTIANNMQVFDLTKRSYILYRKILSSLM